MPWEEVGHQRWQKLTSALGLSDTQRLSIIELRCHLRNKCVSGLLQHAQIAWSRCNGKLVAVYQLHHARCVRSQRDDMAPCRPMNMAAYFTPGNS